MRTLKPLTKDQVSFSVRWEPDSDCSERDILGSVASGDDAADKRWADSVLRRLRAGDDSAWCGVIVTATYGEHSGNDSCWGVDLGDAGDAQAAAVAFAQVNGMFEEALRRLNETIRETQTPRTFRMCATKYLCPTDTRGGRVKATHLTTRKSVTIPWNHALDAFDNHCAVACLVLDGIPSVSTSVDGGGYIFGLDPAASTR